MRLTRSWVWWPPKHGRNPKACLLFGRLYLMYRDDMPTPYNWPHGRYRAGRGKVTKMCFAQFGRRFVGVAIWR